MIGLLMNWVNSIYYSSGDVSKHRKYTGRYEDMCM
jgi:hypothetical protein